MITLTDKAQKALTDSGLARFLQHYVGDGK